MLALDLLDPTTRLSVPFLVLHDLPPSSEDFHSAFFCWFVFFSTLSNKIRSPRIFDGGSVVGFGRPDRHTHVHVHP